MNKEVIINKAIRDLVYDKIPMRKSYQYYHCKRDPEQYRHLEENYGIGSPTSVGFTPLAKKHVDVLVGEYLGLDQELETTCNDLSTLNKIIRNKQLKVYTDLFNESKSYLNNELIKILINNKEAASEDPMFIKHMEDLKKSLETDYTSEYEIAAQELLIYFRQSSLINLKEKLKELFTDLLITGTCYYRVWCHNDQLLFEVLNPLNTFVERNPNSNSIKHSRRVVIKKYMTYEDVLNNYDLSKDDFDKLKDAEQKIDVSDSAYFVRTAESAGLAPTSSTGILAGLEVSPSISFVDRFERTFNSNYLVVYDVEWIEFDKKEKRLVRYSGSRIGERIFVINNNYDENIIRSQLCPTDCHITVDGMFFLDKNGQPFSLIYATMNLQDQFDLLHFYRDSLIASSGVKGDYVDISQLSPELGDSLPERLISYLAYKKTGIAPINPAASVDAGVTPINTIYNGYDDTLSPNAMQAIDYGLLAIERQMSNISGVFQEKLGMIEQRDAVSNVEIGIKQSSLLTKQYFRAMDIINKQVNYDLLNMCKFAYKDGLSFSLVIGEKLSRIINILPKHFITTDFNLNIIDSFETYAQKEAIKALSVELIKAQSLDADDIIDIVTTNNLSILKKQIKAKIQDKKKENDTLNQMQQQLQQYDQQIKQYDQQIKALTDENKQLTNQQHKYNDSKLALEKERVELEKEKVGILRNDKDKSNELKDKQLDLEKEQLYDRSKYNDPILDII